MRGPTGGLIGKLNAPGAQAIPQNTADLVTYALEGVVSHGTGTAAYFGRPAAGKTGTAEDFKDAWFCGYVPQLAACVWIGYPKAEISLYGVEGSSAVFGGSLPAQIWNRFMSEAVKKLPVQGLRLPAVHGPHRHLAVLVHPRRAPTTTTTETTTTPHVPAPKRPSPAPTPPKPPLHADADRPRAAAAAADDDDRRQRAVADARVVHRRDRRQRARRRDRARRPLAPSPPPLAPRSRRRVRPARRRLGRTAGRSRRGPVAGRAPRRRRRDPAADRRATSALRESHVHVAGWYFTPSFRLGDGGPTLRELLAEAAERVDVRVLAWAGAPLPLFHPDRREVRAVRDELVRGTRIEMRARRDASGRCTATTRSSCIVDDRVAYVGGIDLTSLGGDRLDSSEHPPRRASAGTTRACASRARSSPTSPSTSALRWPRRRCDAAGRRRRPRGGVEAQLVRTVPERVYDGLPRGEFTILESYMRALRSARAARLSREPVPLVAGADRDPRREAARAAAPTTSASSSLLPAKPNNGARRHARPARRARRRGEATAATRALPRVHALPARTASPVYVHAKIGIVDDSWLTVGSANLNEHSLFNDTEVNVVVRDESFVARRPPAALVGASRGRCRRASRMR